VEVPAGVESVCHPRLPDQHYHRLGLPLFGQEARNGFPHGFLPRVAVVLLHTRGPIDRDHARDVAAVQENGLLTTGQILTHSRSDNPCPVDRTT